MARLRNLGNAQASAYFPPPTGSTRSSPRKAAHESPSKRELRYTSLNDSEDSFLVPKAKAGADGETSPAKKQRVLRPVASNSRLLRKLSDESLAATPNRRERRVRESGLGRDSGSSLSYSKMLAKSMAKKQGRRLDAGLSFEASIMGSQIFEQQTIADEDEVEKSILCDEENEVEMDQGNIVIHIDDEEEEDDDEEPVVNVRRRRQQPKARRVVTDSEEESELEDKSVCSKSQKIPSREVSHEIENEMPPPLASMRPPFRKGRNQISNWAQEVIDLTGSPEPPSSFAVEPPVRVRSASLASSRPTSSESHDAGAILHFSPTPTKQRSPRKAPPVSRPSTPPAPQSPSKLVSPSKKNIRIPNAPALRPSIDAFWDPAVVNDWNDKHSPSKPLLSPRKQKLYKQLEMQMGSINLSDTESDESPPSPTMSPRKKATSPVKQPKAGADASAPTPAILRAQRKDFAARKHAMAEEFMIELDNTITGGKIAELSKSTGGIKLIWSRTLKTTAGRANWRREQIRCRTGSSPTDFKVDIRHHCSIELAEKVIDEPERLYNVLAHEYCHLTTFMISEVRNNPHGAEFKAWGAKVTRAFSQSNNVEVTTKHSYKIEYKYVWECVACGYEFKRHSKSVDPVRHSCGRCKGKLVQTKPTPRTPAAGKTGDAATGKSEYQVFVKTHFARVKKEMAERGEDTQMGKVMENVARQYREDKARRHEEAKAATQVKVDEVEIALEGLKI
ncbi:hypothetical protein DM02DRAFT_608806 [Periconia macrospinosa]|uniref:SprT-like domain-containing protein n=1 Tax=Periconia macrospinosa TaxID=97972 RepID=A0A2V1EB18_9PLEO|nr:hypothetical protein DM02DRAFT_608806 [Periconia macrospinosa]